MNENMPNNNESIEEVPLDLFSQVSLSDDEPVEVVDLSTPKVEPPRPSGKIISIPAGAYEAALRAEKLAHPEEPQQTNE